MADASSIRPSPNFDKSTMNTNTTHTHTPTCICVACWNRPTHSPAVLSIFSGVTAMEIDPPKFNHTFSLVTPMDIDDDEDHDNCRFMGSENPYGNGQGTKYDPSRTLVITYVPPNTQYGLCKICQKYGKVDVSLVNHKSNANKHMAFITVASSTDLPLLRADLIAAAWKPKPFTVRDRKVKSPQVIDKPSESDKLLVAKMTKKATTTTPVSDVDSHNRGRNQAKCGGKNQKKRDLVDAALIVKEIQEKAKEDSKISFEEEIAELTRPLDSCELPVTRKIGGYSLTTFKKPDDDSGDNDDTSASDDESSSEQSPKSVPSKAKIIDYDYQKPFTISFVEYYALLSFLLMVYAIIPSTFTGIYSMLLLIYTCAFPFLKPLQRIRVRSRLTSQGTPIILPHPTVDMRTDTQKSIKCEHLDPLLHDAEITTNVIFNIPGIGLRFECPKTTWLYYTKRNLVVSQELLQQSYTVMNMVPINATDEDIYSRIHRTINSTSTINFDRSLLLDGTNVGLDTTIAAYHYAIAAKLKMTKKDFHLPLTYRTYATFSTDTDMAKSNCLTSPPQNDPRRYAALGGAMITFVVLFTLALSLPGATQLLSSLTQWIPPQFLPALKSVLRIARLLVPNEWRVILGVLSAALSLPISSL